MMMRNLDFFFNAMLVEDIRLLSFDLTSTIPAESLLFLCTLFPIVLTLRKG